MEVEIEEFLLDGECPKCGARNEDTKVVSTLTQLSGRWAVDKREVTANIQTRFIVRENGTCAQDGVAEGVEHLHRTCLLCTFNWSEETK